MVLIYEDLLNQCIPTWWCLWFEHLEFRGIIPKDSGSYVSSSLVLIYALDLDVAQIILWLFFLIFFYCLWYWYSLFQYFYIWIHIVPHRLFIDDIQSLLLRVILSSWKWKDFMSNQSRHVTYLFKCISFRK